VKVLRGPALPVLLAVVVVGASAAGATALMADKGSGSKKAATPAAAPPVRNAAWTVDSAHDASDLADLSGAWVTADVVVRGGKDGLHAVKRSDGSSAWDLPVPVDGAEVCAMSPTADGGVGVFSFEGKDALSCTSVSGVDLASGHVVWTAQTAVVAGSKDADAPAVAVDGGIAMFTSVRPGTADPKGVASIVGLDAHSGAVKWKHTTTCDHHGGAFAAGGGKVATVETCGSAATVVVLDSATGTAATGTGTATTSATPSQVKGDSGVISASPLILSDAQTNPTAFLFPNASGPTISTPVSGIDTLFASVTTQGLRLPRSFVGAGVLCATAHQPSCWTVAGKQLALRGLPDGAADAIAVAGSTAEVRLLTLPTPTHARASLCKVAANGTVVVEEDLSLPVSDFLAKNGFGQVSAFGDAKDLVLMAAHPSGATAIVDVR
jgi:hypothetical protein